MALDLTCRQTDHANVRSLCRDAVGDVSVTTRQPASSSSKSSDFWQSMPPSICRYWGAPLPGSILPTRSNRTLVFHLGLVVRISSASAVKSGATIASTNRPGSARNPAIGPSTGTLTPSTEPKALTGSPSQALLIASPRVSAVAAPQGLLCFSTATPGQGSDRAIASAASRSSRLLYESSLPLSCSAFTRLCGAVFSNT